MKITGSTGPRSAHGPAAARPHAGGFSVAGSGGASQATSTAAASATSAATNVADVSALMALQGVGGPEARARALRKGRRLLDALDRLQLATLGEGPSQRHLSLLKGALAEERDATGDIGLDDTLNWAEVRVAVEAAKLEREAEAA